MADPADPHAGVHEHAWEVYDGRPEDQSDGLPARPVPATPRWPWAAAAGAAVVAAGVLGVVLSPAPPVAEPGPGPGPAPAGQPGPGPAAGTGWQRAEGFADTGAVLVTGATEAEGLVLTPDGLVATSLARIQGDGRRPAEFGYSIGGWPASVVATDDAFDIALLRADGFEPAAVVRPGSPVRVGETVTLLDIQGDRLPTLGIAVTVTGTGEVCARAGSPSRPSGFRFSLAVATAEPGAAVVRSDGSVVGLYYGGDEASRHCAISIADVLEAARRTGALD